MKPYKRMIRRISSAMLAAALLIRVVTAAGLDKRIGSGITHALSSPAVAGFLFYLELGQALPLPEVEETLSTPPPVETDDTYPAESDDPAPAEPVEETPSDPEDSADLQQEPSAGQAAAGPAESTGEKESEEASVAAPSGDGESAPEAPETDAPLTFTQADADGVTIGGSCSYTVDKLALLQQPSVLDFQQDGPTVLIVHTHTSEAYAQEAGWEYEETDTARTQDPDFSVIRVGKELAETLESHGISVIHDTSFNDYPSYSGAYNRTLEKIEDWVSQYPSIQMVIDVHRDAAANADGSPVRHAVTLDGVETAQLMLVMGTDEGGLSHPGWQDNLSWALKLQAVLERKYPGLCRNLDLRTERFNQHVTPGSMLVEVGSSGNTLKEALAAARDLGEGLADLIEGT